MDEEYRAEGEPGDGFAVTGTWREYLPIAVSNLLLTIVTIGIYRLWAKARERRYLKSRSPPYAPALSPAEWQALRAICGTAKPARR